MHKRLIERATEAQVVQGKLNVLFTLKGKGTTEENLDSLITYHTRELVKIKKQIQQEVETW